MLAHAIEEPDLRRARSGRLHRRMEMGRHPRAGGRRRAPRRPPHRAALFAHRRGHLRRAFPIWSTRCAFAGAIDGELLIVRDGRVQSFNVLQQRLNRKTVTRQAARGISGASARLRSAGRRRRGSARAAVRRAPRAARSVRRAARRSAHRPLAADSLRHLGRADRRARRSGGGRRRRRCRGGRRRHAQAPRCALSCPAGRKGLWWKWKRDPFIVDAVLMYAQRGHGKRSSFYSDYTFGVWTRGRERRRAGAGRQGLFRLHRRGARRDRPLRPPQHRRPLRPGARGRARARQGPGARSRVRGPAALDPPQIRRRHALSRASAGCAGTSRRARPTGSRRWSGCSGASSCAATARACDVYRGGAGMADEWWSTISHLSPSFTKVKL